MKKSVSLMAVLLLTCMGCYHSQDNHQTVKYYDDGRAKAVVTLVPVFDRQDIKLPWSLADDLTTSIKNRLGRKGNTYLTTANYYDLEERKSSDPHQTVHLPLSDLKKKYPNSEFVILLELAEHHLKPKASSNSILDKVTPSISLDLSMRVRIVDLRGDAPKVILQEMVQQSHLVPKQLAKMEYDTSWGKKTYSITPIGFAHMQFAKEIADRLDSYLVLAKTH